MLKANAELSNIQVGKFTKTDRETVAAERTKLEDVAEIRSVEIRKDTQGRKQPVRKRPAKRPVKQTAGKTTSTPDPNQPKELTGPEKKLLNLLNTDHDLLASLLENFLTGVERFVGPAFDRPTVRDELMAIARRKQLFPDLSEKSTRGEHHTKPSANIKREPAGNLDDIKPENAPSVIPNANAGHDEADHHRGAWPNMHPKLARLRPTDDDDEAFREMVRRGVDPDEARDYLAEQADRWSD